MKRIIISTAIALAAITAAAAYTFGLQDFIMFMSAMSVTIVPSVIAGASAAGESSEEVSSLSPSTHDNN